MTPETVLDVGRETMYLTMMLAAPLLLSALAVGLLIGVFQAATQIQEMTLTFVPKILAMFLALVVAMPFMLATLIGFTEDLYARIGGLGPGL